MEYLCMICHKYGAHHIYVRGLGNITVYYISYART